VSAIWKEVQHKRKVKEPESSEAASDSEDELEDFECCEETESWDDYVTEDEDEREIPKPVITVDETLASLQLTPTRRRSSKSLPTKSRSVATTPNTKRRSSQGDDPEGLSLEEFKRICLSHPLLYSLIGSRPEVEEPVGQGGQS
jgi:DNA phosphorothioation-dependent restriction protein DptG